jgi:hypothetical protein
MLPILIVTWLRQLQQFFIKQEKRTWSKLGNYILHERLNTGESKNPIRIVYMKSSEGQIYKVKNYFNIKPDETYRMKKQVVCTSLEEWAMSILKPPVQKHWTKPYHQTLKLKRDGADTEGSYKAYVFKLDSKNYAVD